MGVQDSKRLGWRARTSLEDGMRLAYRAFLNESKQATVIVIASGAKRSIDRLV
jgi:hypothetical protein